MVNLQSITKLWKNSDNERQNGLIAEFRQLTDMKKYVPYLKDFNFKQTSLQAGDVKSSFKGRGMEFEEVRAYSFGDDVRDIDWRVTARKNQPYTKLYAEEKDREVYAWLDLSAVMRFGTRHELKSVTAAKTAALLGWFTLENKDRFGLAVFDGCQTYFFNPKRNYDNLLAVLKKIEQITIQTLHKQSDEQTYEKSLLLLQKRLHARSIVFLIGSFTDLNDGTRRMISGLSHNNELYLVNVYDVLEAIAPPSGEYPTEYGLQRQILRSTGKNFKENYAAYFIHKRLEVKNFCTKFNCHYREIRTDLPVYKQLRPI